MRVLRTKAQLAMWSMWKQRCAAAPKQAYWAVWRWRRRQAWRVIEWLIVRHRWHNTVLDTAIPNVACLKVKQLIVVNSYGQEHVIRNEAA